MKRYVIEREMPGLGSLSPEQVRDASRISNTVLAGLDGNIQWEHSYITADRLYCVYLADSEAIVREHARRAGFPATKVIEVKRVIDPLTGTTGSA